MASYESPHSNYSNQTQNELKNYDLEYILTLLRLGETNLELINSVLSQCISNFELDNFCDCIKEIFQHYNYEYRNNDLNLKNCALALTKFILLEIKSYLGNERNDHTLRNTFFSCEEILSSLMKRWYDIIL